MYLQNTLAQQAIATAILATGSSQMEFLDALITLGGIDWSKVTLFHLDEYLGIDENHPASFRRYLRDRLEHRVNPGTFHYIEGDTREPLAECDRYRQLLQAQPIDLCFLGVGDNGHLAFNEPDVALFDDAYSVKLVKLNQITRQQQVNTGFFQQVDEVPQYAFTLTLPMLCAAQKIVCLAPGKRKAEIVKKLLTQPITPTIPATILRQQSSATLFLDTDSASLL